VSEQSEDGSDSPFLLGFTWRALGVFWTIFEQSLAQKDALGQTRHRVQFWVFNDVMRWSYGIFY